MIPPGQSFLFRSADRVQLSPIRSVLPRISEQITGSPLAIASSIARGSPFFKIDVDRTLENSSDGQYKILLSHTPRFQKEMITKAQYDLQLSGHTHGGQIFPFHLLVKQANKYLAGLYDVNDTKLYLSRGTGYWGPPMRLFAPSEITVIRLKPEK